MALSNNKLQYILREAFSSGVPLFTNHIYKSPEQLKRAISSFRKQILDSDKGLNDYFFLAQERPKRFDKPDETSYFLGFKDSISVKRNFYEFRTSLSPPEELDDSSLISMVNSSGTLPVRMILNARLFILHPSCLLSYSEWEKCKLSPWEEKFPIKEEEIIDTDVGISEIYGELNAGVGDILGEFLGCLGKHLSPEQILRLNIDNQLP